MMKTEWIRCPVCDNKTRGRIREDTVLINYPLYCPKCKQETLVKAKNLHITVIKEPDAQTQSRQSCETPHGSFVFFNISNINREDIKEKWETEIILQNMLECG